MSFKGFGKSIVRAPQSFREKFNLGEVTRDEVFLDSERRFNELEQETKRLHAEATKYSTAINSTPARHHSIVLQQH